MLRFFNYIKHLKDPLNSPVIYRGLRSVQQVLFGWLWAGELQAERWGPQEGQGAERRAALLWWLLHPCGSQVVPLREPQLEGSSQFAPDANLKLWGADLAQMRSLVWRGPSG